MLTVISGKVEQEIIFFIGPPTCGVKPVLEDFVHPGGKDHSRWLALLEEYLGIQPEIVITDGGKRGYATSSLHLDLVNNITPDGNPLFSSVTPTKSALMCFAMCELLDVDWVDLWYTGLLGNSEIRCDRGGSAVQLLVGGRKIELGDARSLLESTTSNPDQA